jgi:DNA-binding NarL/FixJ family response regulator
VYVLTTGWCSVGVEAFEQLSPREQEVLFALMNGETTQEICKQDFVSMSTVRSHIQSIFSKLGVKSQLEAVSLAYRSGWDPDDSRRAFRRREIATLQI